MLVLHKPHSPNVSIKVRLESFSIPEPNTGCWIWHGSVNSNNYPCLGVGRSKSYLAHRLSYETYIGSIKEYYQIHHKCGNTFCVNPNHLEALSIEEHKDKHKK